jgi:hypothetical protein
VEKQENRAVGQGAVEPVDEGAHRRRRPAPMLVLPRVARELLPRPSGIGRCDEQHDGPVPRDQAAPDAHGR